MVNLRKMAGRAVGERPKLDQWLVIGEAYVQLCIAADTEIDILLATHKLFSGIDL